MKYHLGLDIGSVSINTVLMDSGRNIFENRYDYCHGRPFQLLKEILSSIFERYDKKNLVLLGITGTGGQLTSSLIGGRYVNEIVAQSNAVANLYPEVRTIIEMGGEDSKLIFMDRVNGRSELADFAMNSICAAGTGSFLDQQARRIGVSIEEEFGSLALQSKDPPRIAGRCSVFAKSDMIHLQQIATPVCDIVAGLCYAVARNFKTDSLAEMAAAQFAFQGFAQILDFIFVYPKVTVPCYAKLRVGDYFPEREQILYMCPDNRREQAEGDIVIRNFTWHPDDARKCARHSDDGNGTAASESVLSGQSLDSDSPRLCLGAPADGAHRLRGPSLL